MHRSVFLTVALMAFGCEDSARSRIDGVEPDPVDRGAAVDGSPTDAMPGDPKPADAMLDATPHDSMPPDAMPPDAMLDAMPDAIVNDSMPSDGAVDDCPFEIELLPVDELRDFEPIVDGTTVYVSARGPEGHLRTVRAADGVPAGGPTDRLLAARDGALLLARPDGDGVDRLIYRDGGGDVALAERFDWPYGGAGVDWRPPRWVEPGRAIFVADGALYRWQGGAVERVAQRVGEAVLADGRVGYVVPRPGDVAPTYEIWLDDRLLIGPEPDYVPGTLRAGDEGLWAAFGGRIELAPWDGGPRRSWGELEDRVVAVEVSGRRAVAVSQRDDGEAVLWRLRLVHEPLLDDGLIVPRLAGDNLVSATWPTAESWCAGFEPGRLTWGPLDQARRPLSDVGTGCLCCGRYWPRFTLGASDSTIAWSYAGDEGAPAIGIARRRCR